MARSADPRLPRTAVPEPLRPGAGPRPGGVGVHRDGGDRPGHEAEAGELTSQRRRAGDRRRPSLSRPDGHDARRRRSPPTRPSSELTLHARRGRWPPGPGTDWPCDFTGILNDKLHGFYRSTFTDDDGDSRDHRHHPVRVDRRPPGVPVLGRARLQGHLRGHPGRRRGPHGPLQRSGGRPTSRPATAGAGSRFAETMLMSTYLVAFVVGPFELTEPGRRRRRPAAHRHPPGRAAPDAASPSRPATPRPALPAGVLRAPLPRRQARPRRHPRLRLRGHGEPRAASPTGRRRCWSTPSAASQLELQRVANVVAHETAHMWFGDLVTMKWWNGIWLNEAFATFMELTTTDDFRPDWDVWVAFGAGKAAAMATDGLRATRPVEFAGRPARGGRGHVRRAHLPEGRVGAAHARAVPRAEVFRDGHRRYLKTHRLRQHRDHRPVGRHRGRVGRAGPPDHGHVDPPGRLSAGHRRCWDAGGNSLVAQPAALPLRRDRRPTTRWVDPDQPAGIGRRAGRAPAACCSTPRPTTVDLDGPVDWVVVNDGGWGFYRVRYSAELLGRLDRPASQEPPTPSSASGLLGDTWAAVARRPDPSRTGSASSAPSGDEEDPDVWGAVLAPSACSTSSPPTSNSRYWRRSSAAWPARRSPAWAGTRPPGSRTAGPHLPVRLVAALGTVGADPEVRAEAAARYEQDRGRAAPAWPPDLRTAVVNVVAAAGGDGGLGGPPGALPAPRPTPRRRCATSTPWPRSTIPTLLARTLELGLTDEVRNQDGPFLVGDGHRQPGRWRRGVGVGDRALGRLLSRFPGNLFVRMLDGVTGLVDPAAGAAGPGVPAAPPGRRSAVPAWPSWSERHGGQRGLRPAALRATDPAPGPLPPCPGSGARTPAGARSGAWLRAFARLRRRGRSVQVAWGRSAGPDLAVEVGGVGGTAAGSAACLPAPPGPPTPPRGPGTGGPGSGDRRRPGALDHLRRDVRGPGRPRRRVGRVTTLPPPPGRLTGQVRHHQRHPPG